MVTPHLLCLHGHVCVFSFHESKEIRIERLLDFLAANQMQIMKFSHESKQIFSNNDNIDRKINHIFLNVNAQFSLMCI